MLIAEELVLIAFDDEEGRDETRWANLDSGLAGALLLDLSLAGALDLRDDAVVVVGAAPPGAPLLAEALEAIRADEKPREAKAWIERLPRALKPLRERVARGLVDQGVLREEQSKVLGLFNRTRFPEADGAPERELRWRLTAVLVDGAQPDARTALLCSLLVPLELVREVVPKADRGDATKRAKAVAEHGVVGEGLAKLVAEMQMAVMVAVFAATTVTTTTAVSN